MQDLTLTINAAEKHTLILDLVLGMGCIILLWHSLGLPYIQGLGLRAIWAKYSP